MQKLSMIQTGFADDMGQLEKWFLNEIENIKTTMKEEHTTEWLKWKAERESEVSSLNMEINRLTLLVKNYKEKLTKRETTNRDLLVELHLYKSWQAKYQALEQKYNVKL